MVSNMMLVRGMVLASFLVIVSSGCTKKESKQIKPQETEARAYEEVWRNNFVTEFCNTAAKDVQCMPDGGLVMTVPVELSSPGWIYVSLKAKSTKGTLIWATLNDEAQEKSVVAISTESAISEGMRQMAAGSHQVKIWLNGEATIENVTVRRIPEIVFYMAEYMEKETPLQYFSHSKEFLETHVFPHCNAIVSNRSRNNAYASDIAKWRASGRQWMLNSGLKGIRGKSSAEMSTALKSNLVSNIYDAILLDEAQHEDAAFFARYAEALDLVRSEPAIEGKWIIFFSGWTDGVKDYKPLIEGIMRNGAAIAPECYVDEQPTEAALEKFMGKWVSGKMREWKKLFPSIEQCMLLTLATANDSLRYSNDRYVNVDYKVHLDRQLHLLANDPAFANLSGLCNWTAHYCDEEALRWYGKLLRHYCIEGHTEKLSSDPYETKHLLNGDFEGRESDWTFSPAAEGSIVVLGTGEIPPRASNYSPVPQGKYVLCMKRTPQVANLISQEIRELVPGQTYSVKFFSQNLTDSKTRIPVPLTIRIEGVEILPEKSRDRVWEKESSSSNCVTSHYRVFRAAGKTAKLTIVDIPAAEKQDIWLDLVQVQPYML